MNEFLSFSAYLIASALAHGVVLAALVGWDLIPAPTLPGARGSGGGSGAIFVSVMSEEEAARSAVPALQNTFKSEVTIPVPVKDEIRKATERVSPARKLHTARTAPSNDPASSGGMGTGSGSGIGAGQGEGIGAGSFAGGGSGPAGEGVIFPVPLRAPHPRYPREARQGGFEGKVVLAVLVPASGSPETVELVQSSGRDDCDLAAIDIIRNEWFFAPAKLNGIPIDWKQRVVVSYKLR